MATVDDIKAWLNDPASGSGVYGRNWSGLCQAFVWQLCNRFGSAPAAYGSAYAAFEASAIASMDPHAAPAGAIHYWAIAMPDGHVAVSLGDGICIMGSSKVSEMWATNAGAVSVEEYTAKVGGHYLGWSYSNGANMVSIDTTPDITLGLSEPAQFGVQRALADLQYYSGPINGVLDSVAIRSFQKYLVDNKILPASYTVDGIPGPLLKQAVHTLAQAYKPGEADSEGVYQWASNVVNTLEKPVIPVVKPVEPVVPPVVPVVPVAPVTDPALVEAGQALSTAFDIGSIIPTAKGRRIAYGTFGVVGLVVGNTAVALAAAGLTFPLWLVMALAVVGNLSPMFSALAIANAKTK